MPGRRTLITVPVAALLSLVAAIPAAAGAAVGAGSRSMALIQVAKGNQGGGSGNQSDNWFGYNVGTLERNGATFHSVSANWTVPRATLHTKGQDEFSSTWVGIGGGCIDAGCLAGDNTLIQAGTEQDVAANGKQSYSAWWEIIPAPSTTISGMTVAPGDHMYVSVAETSPNSEMWTITVKNLSRGQSFSTTVPYSSSHATAEWIEETPLVLDTSGAGLAALPNLSTVPFSSATLNGADPHLLPTERISLVDGAGSVIGAPSAPNSAGNGFSDCAWRTTC